MPNQFLQRVGQLLNCGGEGGTPGPCPLGKTVQRRKKNLPKDWREAITKFDNMVHQDTMKVVPKFQAISITGDYVHEPRLVGTTTANLKEIDQQMKKSGWKAPSKWNKADSITYINKKGNHQITVSKQESTGGGGGRQIKSYPQYEMPDLS